jgi:hypothetical protein
MKIEIKSATTGEQTIKPSGKQGAKVFEPFTKISQTAFIHGMIDRNGSPEPYAVKIAIDLGTTKERRPAYPPGVYEIDDASFFVDRFDGLCLGRLALKPVAAVLKAAA